SVRELTSQVDQRPLAGLVLGAILNVCLYEPSAVHLLLFFSDHGDHRDLHSFPTRRSSDLAADKGKDTRDYLAAAFPELNAWERAGADASSAGMVDAGFENQKELTKMQLDNQKEIAEMQNETQKEIAGIQSATSRQNTKD